MAMISFFFSRLQLTFQQTKTSLNAVRGSEKATNQQILNAFNDTLYYSLLSKWFPFFVANDPGSGPASFDAF
jgi:hypothetical protein